MNDDDTIAIDLSADTIRIFGMRYSLGLFRTLAFGAIGGVFRIVNRADGVVTLGTVEPPVVEAHDADR